MSRPTKELSNNLKHFLNYLLKKITQSRKNRIRNIPNRSLRVKSHHKITILFLSYLPEWPLKSFFENLKFLKNKKKTYEQLSFKSHIFNKIDNSLNIY